MKLPAVTDRVEDVSHFVQSVGIAETERVVENDGDAVFLRDQCCARKPRQDAQLLSGTARQRLEGTVRPSSAAAHSKVGVHINLERGPENRLTDLFDLCAKRLDIAQSCVVTMSGEHCSQRLHRPGAVFDPRILRDGMFVSALGSVRLLFRPSSPITASSTEMSLRTRSSSDRLPANLSASARASAHSLSMAVGFAAARRCSMSSTMAAACAAAAASAARAATILELSTLDRPSIFEDAQLLFLGVQAIRQNRCQGGLLREFRLGLRNDGLLRENFRVQAGCHSRWPRLDRQNRFSCSSG